MTTPPSSQNKLVIYLIILLGAVGGYLYYSKFSEPETLVANTTQAGDSNDWDSLKNLKIDFNILNKPEYKNLKIFGESPVNPGFRGKSDPFSGF